MSTSRTKSSARARIGYLLGAAVIMGLGLAWRLPAVPFSYPVKKYGADALWAWLVYLLIRFLQPAWTIGSSACIALAFAAFIEFSQIYHAPWIDAIRATHLGALVLGSVFNWTDIPAYALGISFGVLLDGTQQRRS